MRAFGLCVPDGCVVSGRWSWSMRERTEKEEEHIWGLGGDHTHFTYEIIKSHSLDCRDCGAVCLLYYGFPSAIQQIRIVWFSLVVLWFRISPTVQGHQLNPWSGKIPRAAEQLNPCTATTLVGGRQLRKPVRPGVCALYKRSHCT